MNAERALGTFTRRKLKNLDTWSQWTGVLAKQPNLINFMNWECLGPRALLPPMLSSSVLAGNIASSSAASIILATAAMAHLALLPSFML
jgi:hypothetical protein